MRRNPYTFNSVLVNGRWEDVPPMEKPSRSDAKKKLLKILIKRQKGK